METHERAGTVTAVGQHTVTVTFKRSEACGGCAVRNFCHAGNDGENKAEIKVTDASSYHVGERVTLTISEKSAVYAALIAYALPLAFTLAGLFIPLAAGAGEDTAAFSALAAPALYYLLLFFFRRRIGTKQKLNCDKCKKRFCIPRIYVMYKRIICKFSRELP